MTYLVYIFFLFRIEKSFGVHMVVLHFDRANAPFYIYIDFLC